MVDKLLLMVCEGETDIYVFEALVRHFSTANVNLQIISLAPQQDATSGTYPRFGYGNVLNWCTANKARIQMLIDFRSASALFVQMDTDIAQEANPSDFALGLKARDCCKNKLNQQFGTTTEPTRCHYILPTQNTETWLLACHDNVSVLDENHKQLTDYEQFTKTEEFLITLGYASKKRANSSSRKLNKKPAKKYKQHGEMLVNKLAIARPRCTELNMLCTILQGYAQ